MAMPQTTSLLIYRHVAASMSHLTTCPSFIIHISSKHFGRSFARKLLAIARFYLRSSLLSLCRASICTVNPTPIFSFFSKLQPSTNNNSRLSLPLPAYLWVLDKHLEATQVKGVIVFNLTGCQMLHDLTFCAFPSLHLGN